MKKIIRKTNERRINKREISAGISIGEDDKFVFNWRTDNPETDILLLNQNTSGKYNDGGIMYAYGYVYNPKVDTNQRKLFRQALKNWEQSGAFIFAEDVEDFVEEGIFRLDSYKRFSEFGAIVDLESTSSNFALTDVMFEYISHYIGPGIEYKLIKKLFSEVKFDDQQAYDALIANGYSDRKAQKSIDLAWDKLHKYANDLFAIKRFLPKEIRGSFSDFLKFKDENQRKLYESLQGVDVLIYDDFITSGSTVKEIIRYLRSINDANTLTVFALINQG
jgi:hypothetical protein